MTFRTGAAALALFLSLGGMAPAFAQSTAKTENVSLSLLADGKAAAGQTVMVAVRQEIRPKWHTYWRNPGDSGLPTNIVWSLPKGISAGAIQWPRPSRFDIGPIINFGYANEAVLLVPLTIGAEADLTHVPVKAAVDWLVCEEICVPEQAEVAIDLAAPPSADDVTAIARARAALPKNWPGSLTAQASGTMVELTLSGAALGPVSQAYLYGDPGDGLDFSAKPKVTSTGGDLVISLPRANKAPVPQNIGGVIDLGDKRAFELQTIPVTAAAAATPIDPDAARSIVEAVLFAFIGGLILNLMPCVLPILSMKALSLARTGGDVHELRRDGVFYFLGVLATFGSVAITLLALKAGGEAIGWGFQLQSPPVVLGLTVLMVAIALNLLGVFEVPLSLAGVGQNLTTGGGGRAAFFTGVLAVLVASPCTAPFMGAALGFALTQSAPAALGVFLALGVGFAAPFSALTLSPRLVGMIPKPGPWMVTFKEFLAFPMFATAIWLTWVLSQQTGPDGVALVLTASLTFAFLVWVAPRLPELVVWALGLAAAAVLFWAAGAIEPAAALTKDKSGMWAPWSAQAVQQARTQGQPILVDFTAAWCVTCLVNERVALDVPETRRLLKQANVVTLKGDWTRRDGAISAELTRFGRAGVPLYLFYPVGGEPVVLPQILTPGLVQEVVTQKPVG